MRKRQQSNGNYRLNKHFCITINGPLKMLLRHFGYFHCSSVKMTFNENIMKKNCHFFTSSKFLVCRQTLRSGNRCQENGGPLNNYQTLLKKSFFICLVYLNWRNMRYLKKTVRWKCYFVIFGIFIFSTFLSEYYWFIKRYIRSL